MLLKLLDLLEVAVGEIQEENAERDADETGEVVVLAEEERIDRIEYVPYSAPDHHEANDDREGLNKIAEVLMWFVLHIASSYQTGNGTSVPILPGGYLIIVGGGEVNTGVRHRNARWYTSSTTREVCSIKRFTSS